MIITAIIQANTKIYPKCFHYLIPSTGNNQVLKKRFACPTGCVFVLTLWVIIWCSYSECKNSASCWPNKSSKNSFLRMFVEVNYTFLQLHLFVDLEHASQASTWSGLKWAALPYDFSVMVAVGNFISPLMYIEEHINSFDELHSINTSWIWTW